MDDVTNKKWNICHLFFWYAVDNAESSIFELQDFKFSSGEFPQNPLQVSVSGTCLLAPPPPHPPSPQYKICSAVLVSITYCAWRQLEKDLSFSTVISNANVSREVRGRISTIASVWCFCSQCGHKYSKTLRVRTDPRGPRTWCQKFAKTIWTCPARNDHAGSFVCFTVKLS